MRGLPERLAALDDEGNAVNSATGEFFFHVENMVLGETYTKNIQLMNLREDESYHIYFCVEPLRKSGEIDLEKGCTCHFLLDGKEFFAGNVNGSGNIDLTEYYDCGNFAPGDSHVLRCEIVFNEMAINQEVDNGWRLVDIDGVHVLRGPGSSGSAYGEIEFKWIFCAKVDTADNDDPILRPRTGIMFQDGLIWLLGIALTMVMIAGLLVLIKKQKKTDAAKSNNPVEKVTAVEGADPDEKLTAVAPDKPLRKM